MSKLITAEQLAAGASKSAVLATVHAQAMRSYTQPSGTLAYVRVTTPHLIMGQYVAEGDIVQVTEADAKALALLERAVTATQEEVDAAQKATKTK